MIFSSLDVDYTKMGYPAAIVRALDFLKNTNLHALEPGSYELEPNRKMYVNIDEVHTRVWEDTKPESHKDYIDIQYMVSGEEDQGFFTIREEEPVESHVDRDLYFYEPTSEDEGLIHLAEGNFTVFFPQDAHRPLVATVAPILIRKAVVKVHVSLLGE
ncbi:MAG: YhcH/YjgK/YiaL family protein [Veillonella sp.]|nr:YhcH/YjgK/YiaL family protein [Veillonella sp.]